MFRRVAPLLLALLVVACGGPDPHAPVLQSRIPPGLPAADWPPPGWTWGLIQVGDAPAQRYGVAGPDSQSRAQVLILPGFGETAEDMYPLVNALIADQVTVWVLDGAGQGGSGRVVSRRDLGHVDRFEGDLAAMDALIKQAIRPKPEARLVIVADSTTALIALRRVQLGEPGVAGLVLKAPVTTLPAGPLSRWAATAAEPLGLTGLPAPDFNRPASPDRPRDSARAWRASNPALKVDAASLGWIRAFEALQIEVARGGLTQVRAPVLLLPNGQASGSGGGRFDDRLCAALAGCSQGPASEPLARSAILAFVNAVIAPSLAKTSPHALPNPADHG